MRNSFDPLRLICLSGTTKTSDKLKGAKNDFERLVTMMVNRHEIFSRKAQRTSVKSSTTAKIVVLFGVGAAKL